MPINLTISANFRCNFRCVTCNVYERKVVELTADEWAQVFSSIGRAPTWMTFSGGEPFLRDDLPDIITSAIRICRPTIVNIPTNGWFVDRTADGVDRICRADRRTQVVVNLSIDHHTPERHDEIRVKKGSYEKLMQTYARLRALDAPNLTIGVHTVVSNANAEDFPDIPHGLSALGADSYICEPAEERVELQTIGLDITPEAARFARASQAVLDVDRTGANGMVAKIARAIREQYYERVTRLLDGDDGAMPACHAGFLSAHIGADGDVWPCCIIARTIGNVRAEGFDFRRVWGSQAADAWRDELRGGTCTCPLANAAYTNLLLEPRTMARVLGDVAGLRRRTNGRAHKDTSAVV